MFGVVGRFIILIEPDDLTATWICQNVSSAVYYMSILPQSSYKKVAEIKTQKQNKKVILVTLISYQLVKSLQSDSVCYHLILCDLTAHGHLCSPARFPWHPFMPPLDFTHNPAAAFLILNCNYFPIWQSSLRKIYCPAHLYLPRHSHSNSHQRTNLESFVVLTFLLGNSQFLENVFFSCSHNQNCANK